MKMESLLRQSPKKAKGCDNELNLAMSVPQIAETLHLTSIDKSRHCTGKGRGRRGGRGKGGRGTGRGTA